MNLSLKILVLLVGFLFITVFVSLARKKTVKPFYSLLWLLVSLFVISLVPFEHFYKWIATHLGISDASFLVIVGFISFLLIFVLYLSIKISTMSDRIQELISATSILEREVRVIKEIKTNTNESSK